MTGIRKKNINFRLPVLSIRSVISVGHRNNDVDRRTEGRRDNGSSLRVGELYTELQLMSNLSEFLTP